MKLTVLVDNNTLIDRYFLGEPGLSFWIQEGATQILFDVGYSNAFILNAQKMKIKLLETRFLVLSHGHLDHTWGLDPLLRLYTEAHIEGMPVTIPTLVAHPEVFASKKIDGLKEIGSLICATKLKKHMVLHLTKDPFWLTDKLVFLGEIKRSNDFENQAPVGEVHEGEGVKPDFLWDDTALAYKGEKGLVIITGCSHSGICNIMEYAKKVCGHDKVIDVIGGFHLMSPPQRQLDQTLEYFRNLKPEVVHPCHCVDLDCKIALSKVSPIQEVGVGLSLEYG